MVEVGPYSAFAVNKIGFYRTPFPLSFAVRTAGESWAVRTTAAQAVELADAFVRAANDTIVVVSLETSFVDKEDGQCSPAQITAAQGVTHETHRLDGLAGVRCRGSE